MDDVLQEYRDALVKKDEQGKQYRFGWAHHLGGSGWNQPAWNDAWRAITRRQRSVDFRHTCCDVA